MCFHFLCFVLRFLSFQISQCCVRAKESKLPRHWWLGNGESPQEIGFDITFGLPYDEVPLQTNHVTI